MRSNIGGIAHVNLRAPVDLTERLRVFCRDVVGWEDGPRPSFRSHGYWLHAGGRDVLHLRIDSMLPASAQTAPPSTGWFNHIAFAATDLATARQRLDGAGVVYELDQEPAGTAAQIFLRDPAGVGVELNFR